MTGGIGRRQSELDAENAKFWNELCGSHLARALGVTGNDPESLARFDRYFFDLYPYLDRFVPFGAVGRKDVLEVGLGYGTVSQRLAERGARLTALDLAPAPVAGVVHRLRQSGLPGTGVQGSILDAPFADGSFDYVVSIGCFHHTGDVGRAIAETARLLRRGGGATLMCYSATSYRRWSTAPRETWTYVRAVAGGDPPPLDVRSIYDVNAAGARAPETVLLSVDHFTRMLRRHFRGVQVTRANVRASLLRRPLLAVFGSLAGLDLYARVTR